VGGVMCEIFGCRMIFFDKVDLFCLGLRGVLISAGTFYKLFYIIIVVI